MASHLRSRLLLPKWPASRSPVTVRRLLICTPKLPPLSLTSSRTLSSSQLSPNQQGQVASPTATKPEKAPRAYSEIPKCKTILGLNLAMMKDPSRLVDYMEQQVRELGFIFKLVGAPGLCALWIQRMWRQFFEQGIPIITQ